MRIMLNLKVQLRPNNKKCVPFLSIPLSKNQKIIDFCGNDKVNVTISNKGKSIKFIVKASKFGSKTNGDRRIFLVPTVLIDDVLELGVGNTVRVIVEKRK